MHVDTVVQRLAADGPIQECRDGWLVRCPVHGDTNPSLLIGVSADRKAVLHCRSRGCEVGDVLKQAHLSWSDVFHVEGEVTADSAVAEELSTSSVAALASYMDRVQAAFADSPAARYATERFGITETHGRYLGLGYDDGAQGFVHASGTYADHPRLVVPFYGADGVTRGAQGRDISGRDQHRWSGLTTPEQGRWSSVAWFLPDAAGPVVVTEGPGDAVTVAAAGHTAVGVAGASHARSPAIAAEIAHAAGDRPVLLAGDADESGTVFNQQLGEQLAERGVTARALVLPDGIGDLADWHQASGEAFATELAEAIRTAKPVSGDGFEGDAVALLDEVRALVARFVVITPPSWYDVITLWIAATYIVRETEAANIAPRLGFLSSVPGSGKTLALDLVCRLVQGHLAVDPTSASVVRLIGAMTVDADDPKRPKTPVPMGIDEIDNLYGNRGQDNSSITTILNSGYKRGNDIVRADTNDQRKALSYSTFAPVVWAGLARAVLPDALLSRTFIVEMHQALPHERPESFRPRQHGPLADHLAGQLAGWAASISSDDDAGTVLDQAEAEFATEMSNRDLELWSMVALPALQAGGHWPDRVRAACKELRDSGKDHAETISVRFLRATRDVYRSHTWGRGMNARVVFRSTLAERVIDADQIFARWSSGRGIDDEHVRKFLSEFQIKPVVVRVQTETGRGFRWADMQPQWHRYLGDDEPEPIEE